MRARLWAVLGIVAILPATSLAGTEAHSRAYGPQSEVRISRPTLRWEVWPGKGSKVTDSLMSLNGTNVRAEYQPEQKSLVYTPQNPLPPGTYRVNCKVVVDGRLPVKRSWEFRVSALALHALPPISATQREAVEAVNGIRRRLGLPAFEMDVRLSAAAQAHANYLARNNITGHYQRASDPGFVGASPSDRLDAFGFSDSSWEGVDFGPASPDECIKRLYAAPYHRIPFMQPGSALIGSGFKPSHAVLEFSMAGESGTVVSPAEGETGVPTTWDGRERPDPLRLHSAKGAVGFPIVFAHFSPGGEKLTVLDAELRTLDGCSVPTWRNTPANDEHLEFAVILFPRKPLAQNASYEAFVSAKTKSGDTVSRRWRFKTSSQ